MLVQLFWRNCDFRGKEWGAEPVDAFWVEANITEAESAIFPHLKAPAVTESRTLADQFQEMAEELGKPARSFCFLVARDLSTIDPFQVHYPFHQLWNGYSPFESMTERIIEHLQELQSLRLPKS